VIISETPVKKRSPVLKKKRVIKEEITSKKELMRELEAVIDKSWAFIASDVLKSKRKHWIWKVNG
jgi:hypothetical protein